jgi:hypothetical protein
MSKDSWEELKDIAIEHGWDAETVPDLSEFEISNKPEDIMWRLYAKRGKETIVVLWRGLSQQKATYNFGDYWLYPAWRGGVIKLLKGQPNIKKFSAKDKGQIVPETYEELLKKRSVPWEHDEVRAFDILLPVLDKEIHWVAQSQIVDSFKLRTEACPKESNLGKSHFRVYTTSRGLRVLEWANAFGFQACYVHNILEVRG